MRAGWLALLAVLVTALLPPPASPSAAASRCVESCLFDDDGGAPPPSDRPTVRDPRPLGVLAAKERSPELPGAARLFLVEGGSLALARAPRRPLVRLARVVGVPGSRGLRRYGSRWARAPPA